MRGIYLLCGRELDSSRYNIEPARPFDVISGSHREVGIHNHSGWLKSLADLLKLLKGYVRRSFYRFGTDIGTLAQYFAKQLLQQCFFRPSVGHYDGGVSLGKMQ